MRFLLLINDTLSFNLKNKFVSAYNQFNDFNGIKIKLFAIIKLRMQLPSLKVY